MRQPADPYNLLDGNWPKEEAVAYLDAARQLLDHVVIYEKTAQDSAASAASFPEEDATHMHQFVRTLDQHREKVEIFVGVLAAAMPTLITTKHSLERLVREGTAAIAAGGDEDTISLYRSKLAAVRAAYDRQAGGIDEQMKRLSEAGTPSDQEKT